VASAPAAPEVRRPPVSLGGLFKAFAAVVAVFVVVKTVWVLAFRLRGADVIACISAPAGTKADLLARRAYLLRRVCRESAGLESAPGMLDELFQGEWALVTQSMTAMALTNVAMADPATHREAAAAVGDLVRLAQRPQIRAFDTGTWREDPFSKKLFDAFVQEARGVA